MAIPFIRRVGGVVAGLIGAGLTVALVEGAGHALFPPPPGLDFSDPGDQARLMSAIPLAAKISVVFAWFFGALAGGWIAVRISGWPAAAWIIGVALVALSLFSTQAFPHPLWMVVCAAVLPLLAAWLALRLSRAT